MNPCAGSSIAKSIAAVLVFASVLFLPVAAEALSVGEAKQMGLVIETRNGYLRAAPGKGTPEVQDLVQRTNAARRREYQSIAERLKVDLSVVERDFGKKLGGR